MVDSVEVSIRSALFDRLMLLPRPASVSIALPNVGDGNGRTFTNPDPQPGATWYRAAFIPAPTMAEHLEYTGCNHHYGMMQVDAVGYMGDGELRIARNAAAVVTHFRRGTRLFKNSFKIEITQAPYLRPLMFDEPWCFIPVDVPYVCYATSFPFQYLVPQPFHGGQ